jgi:signal transduction histidine kinase
MLARTSLEAIRQRPRSFLGSSWPWRSFGYLLSSAALAYLGILVWSGLGRVDAAAGRVPAVAVGSGAVLTVAFFGGWFEAWRVRLVDVGAGRPARTAEAPATPAGPGSVRERLLRRLARRSTWRHLGYAVVSLALLWWLDIVVAALVVVPGLLMTTPFQPHASIVETLVGPLAGIALLPLVAYPITAWAGLRAGMAKTVLAVEDAELSAVVLSRARLVDAFEAERRRIERDLHDGAQLRLVALTMKLGLVGLDLPPGSKAAAGIDEARQLARTALSELRELIRGVHPEILTGRGLPAAVADVAGRSPVPVEVVMRLPDRLPAPVEVTAYYTVCEALTNIARHSGAEHAWIHGAMIGGTLVLEIGDDGVGGADPAAGTGITGIADRIAVTDGRLTISTPAAGPTVLRVEIPCPPNG